MVLNFQTRQLPLKSRIFLKSSRSKMRNRSNAPRKCYDQLEIPFPNEDGEHTFTALASVKKRVVAVGEIKFRTTANVSNDTSYEGPSSPNKQYLSDLAIDLDPTMRINGRPFQNGMWMRMNDATTLKFKFKTTPQCDVSLRCSTGFFQTYSFKPLCNTSAIRN